MLSSQKLEHISEKYLQPIKIFSNSCLSTICDVLDVNGLWKDLEFDIFLYFCSHQISKPLEHYIVKNQQIQRNPIKILQISFISKTCLFLEGLLQWFDIDSITNTDHLYLLLGSNPANLSLSFARCLPGNQSLCPLS